MSWVDEDMIQHITNLLLAKPETRYNKDELTKKILRNIRGCYRHKFIDAHTKSEMSHKSKAMPLLLKHLLFYYNIELRLKPLQLNHPHEFRILLWSFCTKTVQKQAKSQKPPAVFLTGYKKYVKMFLKTEVGFHLYYKPFKEIWTRFVEQADLEEKESFRGYIKSIQQETTS